MNSKHTPGPWVTDGGCVDAGDQTVCYLGEVAQWSGDCFHPLPNAKANAHLIAAAPDLYEALASLVVGFDSFAGEDLNSPRFAAARAALARARGETA